MGHITVRNIPVELAKALEREKHARHQSLNQTVIDLLSAALGVGHEKPRSNGLAQLAGTWTESDYQQFCQTTAATQEVDEEMWR